MRSFKLVFAFLLIVAVLGGCASADKRFSQGYELETQGQYLAAAMRYVQALEKDPNLEAARIRLFETGNLAIAEQLDAADDWISRGDPVSAVTHYQRADGVAARARHVGVRLEFPDDYGNQRRDLFDDAFKILLQQGIAAREQGRWQDSLAACRRARNDFEPTMEQRNQALAEEATLYVQWSDSEFTYGHWREAFAIAARVQELPWSPAEQADHAAALMDDSLAEGEVELIVLPVQTRSGSERRLAGERELAAQIETMLWQGPWREPPAFVSLNDPLVARDLVTHTGILDGEYSASTLVLILRLAEADYGAHLQLLGAETTEFEVNSTTHTVKTRAGKSTTFVQEKGQRRIQATARVVIADGFGNEIADVVVDGSGTAPFARGVYDGDPRELNLSERYLDLFNRIALDNQEQDARDELVLNLTAAIAEAVFRPTLAQIP